MTAPFPAGPRYDTEWADVLDAEFWAQLRAMSETRTDPETMRRAYRVARFFPRREYVR